MPQERAVRKYLHPMARPDPGELRSRREERNLNGVKNLLGARPSPNIFIKQSRIWRCFLTGLGLKV